MGFLELVHDRYSCRKFSDKPVSEDILDKVLEAGIYAPTAKNVQPVKIWVFKSEDALAKIKTCTPFKWMENVPVVVGVGASPDGAFLRPTDKKNFAECDASIVATHIMLAVHAFGLASTWVGMFDAPKVHELFPDTQGYEMLALFPIGYPAEDSQPSERHTIRKSKSEMVKFL